VNRHRTVTSRLHVPSPARSGFTIIELLVVIGILIILAALTLVGMKHVRNSGAANATRTVLSNCDGLVGTMEAADATRVPNPFNATSAPGLSFPIFAQNPDFPSGGTAVALPIKAPAGSLDPNATTGKFIGRYCVQVVWTQRVIRTLMSVPANRAAVQAWPQNQKMLEVRGVNGVAYWPGDVIADSDGKQYICTAATTTPPAAGGGGSWNANYADGSPVKNDAPVPLDGWGNPIIYCPQGGFQVVDAAATPQPFKDPDNSNQAVKTVVARDKRPFWASAGADGIFGTELDGTGKAVKNRAGDNLYSFEH